MKKITKMNKQIFHDYLIMTVREIIGDDFDEENLRFKIVATYEKDKTYNGLDDMMCLLYLSEKNLGHRPWNIKDTVDLVACNEPFVPTKIIISLDKHENELYIFNFVTTSRFREPSLLGNADTGHPPFRAIFD